jgi:hypothetical protein
LAELWMRRWWCPLLSDHPQSLCCRWGALPPVEPGWWGRGLAATAGDAKGPEAGGQGGKGRKKQCHYTLCLLGGSCAPCKEDCHCDDGGPAPPPPLMLWGSPPVVSLAGACGGERDGNAAAALLWGGNPNRALAPAEVPQLQQML